MKFTLTKNQRAGILALVGAIAIAIAYFAVYKPNSEKTVDLNKKNDALQSRVDVLQSIADQQDKLVLDTNNNNTKAVEIMDRFPANVYEEDIVMMAVEMQDIAPLEFIESIEMSQPDIAYEFENISAATENEVNGYIPEGVVADAPAEGDATATEEVAAPVATTEAGTPVLYHKKAAIMNTVDYDGLKNAIAYVLEHNSRCSLAVSAAFDNETGILKSNITVGNFYITGTDKEYVKPEINHVVQGTDNIFGTVSLETSRAVKYSRYSDADIPNGVTEEAAEVVNEEGNETDSEISEE